MWTWSAARHLSLPRDGLHGPRPRRTQEQLWGLTCLCKSEACRGCLSQGHYPCFLCGTDESHGCCHHARSPQTRLATTCSQSNVSAGTSTRFFTTSFNVSSNQPVHVGCNEQETNYSSLSSMQPHPAVDFNIIYLRSATHALSGFAKSGFQCCSSHSSRETVSTGRFFNSHWISIWPIYE